MRLIAFALLLVPAVLGALERLAVPSSELEHPIWQRHDPASTVQVDHSAWGAFLERHLRVGPGANRLDYAGAGASGRAALGGYIDTLQGVAVTTLSRDEQFAYWVNLYNAATIALILDNYPLESIRDIGSGLFENGPWDRAVATIEGRTLTLNDIEHGILRPVWNEPRLHYAVNCAALGCPSLEARPWTAAGLDARLSAAEASFIADPRGVRLEGGELVLSKIWLWFREDFAPEEAGVLARLSARAEGRAAQALSGRTSVDRYDYDWSLNDTR